MWVFLFDAQLTFADVLQLLRGVQLQILYPLNVRLGLARIERLKAGVIDERGLLDHREVHVVAGVVDQGRVVVEIVVLVVIVVEFGAFAPIQPVVVVHDATDEVRLRQDTNVVVTVVVGARPNESIAETGFACNWKGKRTVLIPVLVN